MQNFSFKDIFREKIIITGDVGVGKTRLLAKMVDDVVKKQNKAKDIVVLDFAPNIPLDYEHVTRSACLQSVHFITINDKVSKGAEAIFQLFYTANKSKLLFILYKWVPPFRFTSELIYNWIAKNRHLF